MNEIAKIKKQLKIREWAEQVEACQNSGLPVREWCRQNNIHVDTYYYHLKRVREETLARIGSCVPQRCTDIEDTDVITFKRLEVTAPTTCESSSRKSASITINIHGASIDVGDDINQEALEAVLRALKSVC